MSTVAPEKESSPEFRRALVYDILSFIISKRVEAIAREKAKGRLDHEKIAKLKDEVEFYTQEQDAVLEDDEAAIERVMAVHYPPIKDAYEAHRFAPISPEERRRRQAAVDYARASVGLEGIHLSNDFEDRARHFVNGEIDMIEFRTGLRHAPA